jgi:hypothetical protein
MRRKFDGAEHVADDKNLTIIDLYRQANLDLKREHSITVEALADEANTTPDRIYDYQNNRKDTLGTIALIIVQQARLGAPYVLHRLAAMAGYLLVRVPQVRRNSARDVFGLCRKALNEASQAVEEFAASTEDGEVNDAELGKLNKEFDDAVAAIEQLRHHARDLFEHRKEAT